MLQAAAVSLSALHYSHPDSLAQSCSPPLPPPLPSSSRSIGTRDRVWGRLEMIRSERYLPSTGLASCLFSHRLKALSHQHHCSNSDLFLLSCLFVFLCDLAVCQPLGKNNTAAIHELAVMRPNLFIKNIRGPVNLQLAWT